MDKQYEDCKGCLVCERDDGRMTKICKNYTNHCPCKKCLIKMMCITTCDDFRKRIRNRSYNDA